jgi:predicted amidohydrolase YtcJ
MKRLSLIAVGFLFLTLPLIAFVTASPRISNSAVFVADHIVTMSEDLESPEAIYVRDGRIAAMGRKAAVYEAAGPDAQTIDLGAATLLPGLIEVHTHPLAAALLGTTVDVSGFTHDNRAQILETLTAAADKFSIGPWLLAFGWDPVMVRDLEPPTLAELDRISPKRPLVILTQMMHDAYANSAALEAAGIDASTEDPPGAQFVRDRRGALTGTVREVAAINRLLDAMPEAPAGSADLLLSLQYAKYAQAGITTLGILGPAGNTERPLHIMAKLSADENLPVRAVAYGLPDQLEEGRWQPGPVNERFYVRGVKYWMDGSPFAGGAAWAEPYENSELTIDRLHLPRDHSPELNHDEAEFEEAFESYHRRGFQVAVHVQGERAIDRVLDVVERVQRRDPKPDARHRIEHNALITEEQLERALRLGVTPSFFIDHIYYYGDRLPEIVGSKRTERYMPIATALRVGHRATLHSDNPATPIDPMRVLRSAITRVPRNASTVVGAAERITPAQALRAVTIDAAWQLGLEDRVGSIALGKAADFVVLSSNPLEVEPNALPQIEVLSTWIDGQPIDPRPWRRQNLRLALTALRNALF